MFYCAVCGCLSEDPLCFMCKLTGKFQCWQCGLITEEPIAVEIRHRMESFCPSCYRRCYEIKPAEVAGHRPDSGEKHPSVQGDSDPTDAPTPRLR